MMLVLVQKDTHTLTHLHTHRTKNEKTRKEMAQNQLMTFLWLLAADWSLLISFDLYIVCSAEMDDWRRGAQSSDSLS